MSAGPVVIGFDGSPAAERALREAGALLAPRAGGRGLGGGAGLRPGGPPPRGPGSATGPPRYPRRPRARRSDVRGCRATGPAGLRVRSWWSVSRPQRITGDGPTRLPYGSRGGQIGKAAGRERG